MFEPNSLLLKYLNATPRDVYHIVGALIGYINADPAFKTKDFDSAVQYVLEHGLSRNELFAEFDPSYDFDENSSNWNAEYYSFVLVYLNDNFCEKRIEHAKAVSKKVYSSEYHNNAQQLDTPNQSDTNTMAQGGSQSEGKKIQGQQPQNHGLTTKESGSAKKLILAICITFVLLTVLIVLITLIK